MKMTLRLCGFFLALLAFTAQASIVVGGTRIIYPANKKEVQVTLKNSDEGVKYLVQSWVSNIDDSKAPFIVTPPIYKMEGGRQALLHVVFTGDKNQLPVDKESLFVANIKSVAAMPEELKDKNTLQFAMKTRLKLFWRPTQLTNNDALTAWEKVVFRRQGEALIAKNPTPFYISLLDLTVGGKAVQPLNAKHVPEALAMTLAPFSEQQFRIPSGASGKVAWSAVNDFGAATATRQQNL
ncbi:molecular chaperone [Salmonella enterica subsp. salamae]|nr:molecular chaperone [Salmonella enterica subsp. salamae]ECJ4596323.1 molecular chaperone [Salmonella enterica subsp. salamae]